MEITTRKGYHVRDTWDCDDSLASLSVYDADGNFIGELFGKSLTYYEDEDGNIDVDKIDEDIEEEFL